MSKYKGLFYMYKVNLGGTDSLCGFWSDNLHGQRFFTTVYLVWEVSKGSTAYRRSLSIKLICRREHSDKKMRGNRNEESLDI